MKAVINLTLLSFVIIAMVIGCSSHPKITSEKIQKDIVGRNTGEGFISWIFGEVNPHEFSIVESKYEGDKATIIINIRTNNVSSHIYGEGEKVKVAGMLRLHYEWIANEWNLTRVENLTLKEL